MPNYCMIVICFYSLILIILILFRYIVCWVFRFSSHNFGINRTIVRRNCLYVMIKNAYCDDNIHISFPTIKPLLAIFITTTYFRTSVFSIFIHNQEVISIYFLLYIIMIDIFYV